MVYVYPAIFTNCDEGGYAIHFPDLPGTNSEGDNLAHVLAMARDALAICLDCMADDGETFPTPTQLNVLPFEPDQIITLIDVDLDAYRRHKDSRAVKKTLTIPNWMNVMAEEKGINFSQVLQEGLRQRLDVHDA